LPGAVLAVGEEMGLPDSEIAKAMLASGLVGVFIANQATFGAEVAGCQAENGSGSAMAAAGIVELLGGSAEDGFKAASLAMQNLLGLVCDPIACLAEIPCVNRNTVAAYNAVASAHMVLCGFDPVIPLDETIMAMLSVGRMLPRELRCTGLGGLCLTDTAKRIEAELVRK
jgi:L-serine dehydratase